MTAAWVVVLARLMMVVVRLAIGPRLSQSLLLLLLLLVVVLMMSATCPRRHALLLLPDALLAPV
jgi:hypothetical protein